MGDERRGRHGSPHPAVAAAAFSPGEVFAGQRIDGEVGRGRMGVVYRAFHLALEVPVALKVIRPELAASEDFRGRFQRESRIAASIDHPNVVPIRHAGEADGLLYITMRLVEGTDLAALLRDRGRQPPPVAVAVAAQIAAALDAAHARGLVHRDVKPAHVLLEPRDDTQHAYLTDFGLGFAVGSIDYAAPEQFEGEEPNIRSNVYSLGCVVYHALTGRVPYPSSDAVGTALAHVELPQPSISHEVPDIDPRVDGACRQAMSKNPGERFASASEFAEQLLDAVGGGRSRPAVSLPAWPPRVRIPARRRMRRGIAGAVGLLAVGVALVTVLAGNGPAKPVLGKPIDVGPAPSQLAVGAGSVWLTSARGGEVIRIDPRSESLRPPLIEVGGGPGDIIVAHDAVWVAKAADDTVMRLDPKTGRPIGDPIRVGDGPRALAADDDAVWVANEGDGTISRLHPSSGRTVGRPIPVGGAPISLTIGHGALWVANVKGDSVMRIDHPTGEVSSPIPVGQRPTSVVSAGDYIWVCNAESETVMRLDPDTGQQVGDDLTEVGRLPLQLAAGAGTVWVTAFAEGAVRRIDTSTGDLVGEPLRTGDFPGSIVATEDGAWVTSVKDHTVRHIGI
jgi:DNA-binding beta-propeller fold protein YncE